MSIVYGEWVDIRAIAEEAAKKEREQESRRIPRHPRTEFLETDLHRAINILNNAGFTVVREKEDKGQQRFHVHAVATVPAHMKKELLIDYLNDLHWYGEKLFQRDQIIINNF